MDGAFNLRATTLHKCAAVRRRARTAGAHTLVSLNSRLDSDKEEEEECRATQEHALYQVRNGLSGLIDYTTSMITDGDPLRGLLFYWVRGAPVGSVFGV